MRDDIAREEARKAVVQVEDLKRSTRQGFYELKVEIQHLRDAVSRLEHRLDMLAETNGNLQEALEMLSRYVETRAQTVIEVTER